MQARKMLTNASYFAFTATPKNKTLEMFGQPLPPDAQGKVKHRPFHIYTMKQAIQEGFILDVLKSYTPVDSYYKLVKKIEGDPEFDTKRAQKKLRKYVESHDHAIRLKAEIMVDHFHEQVMALNKIGGKARAMLVCSGIERAVQYFHAFKEYLQERKSPYQAIIAFSGEHEFGGANVTESSLNGFPSGDIADKIQEDPYRFLICADKFQTGYDEPLLHTMYVDKPLSGIKAVQTLSRLNRAHPEKHDVFVLPYTNRDWEKLFIVLNLLIPKLPAPKDEDLSKGILEAIDMDSYRVEKRAAMKLALADDNAEIGPIPVEGGGHKPQPELDRLSNILKAFNDHFGTLFADADRVSRRITEDIAPKVAADQSYRNAKQNTPNSARIEHDKALSTVMLTLLKDDTQVYKQFVENESFRRFVTDMLFTLTNA
jgi:type I site-specific restriction-modification system R (restriction) subunit